MKKLYFGAKILTLKEPMFAEAVLVEDGRIIAVGERSALLETSNEPIEEIDLGGGVLMPSFIDAHGHFISVVANYAHPDLRGARSIDEIGSIITDHIRKNNVEKGKWIVAKSYDENLLPEAKHPTLAELDRICPDNPLYISHTTGHAGLYNSAALELIGITPDTPVGTGEIAVDAKGRMTGYMSEGANNYCNAKIPPIDTAVLLKHVTDAQKKYASYGITTVQDGFLGRRALDVYLETTKKGELKLDVIGYSPIKNYDALCAYLESAEHDDRVKIGGIKSFIDGSPQLRTAFVREAYLGSDGKDFGAPVRDFDFICDLVRTAAEKNAQPIIHSNGDMAVEWFLQAVEKTAQTHPQIKELRPVIIHAQLMGTDQLPRAKALGAVVSFYVAHTYHFADAHIRNLGLERAKKISPARSALDEGLHFTFHQDAPVIEPDMIETLWCAANRITRDGVHLEGEEISVLDAIRAVTIEAAYQYGEENIKGSIEAGKLADFVLLDRDPLEIRKEDLRDVKILRTFKRGECIYEAE